MSLRLFGLKEKAMLGVLKIKDSKGEQKFSPILFNINEDLKFLSKAEIVNLQHSHVANYSRGIGFKSP